MFPGYSAPQGCFRPCSGCLRKHWPLKCWDYEGKDLRGLVSRTAAKMPAHRSMCTVDRSILPEVQQDREGLVDLYMKLTQPTPPEHKYQMTGAIASSCLLL